MAETTIKSIASEVLTVMFVDIVGYAKTPAKPNPESLKQEPDVFKQLSPRILKRYEGNLVKKVGDAFLIVFHSATNALLCGIELQQAFAEYNRKNKPTLTIKVAVHAGEVLIKEENMYGDAVNTASHLGQGAKPGDVIFSEAVFLFMNKMKFLMPASDTGN